MKVFVQLSLFSLLITACSGQQRSKTEKGKSQTKQVSQDVPSPVVERKELNFGHRRKRLSLLIEPKSMD